MCLVFVMFSTNIYGIKILYVEAERKGEKGERKGETGERERGGKGKERMGMGDVERGRDSFLLIITINMFSYSNQGHTKDFQSLEAEYTQLEVSIGNNSAGSHHGGFEGFDSFSN